MKIIPKFQSGGNFDSLFTIYKPVASPTPSRRQAAPSEGRRASKRDDDDSDKGKLTEKDLFLMLKELDGLPNDIQDLVRNLSVTLENARLLGQEDLAGVASTYLSSLYKLKQAAFNKDQYANAYNRAKDAGGLNEIAITTEGYVVVQDSEKGIKFIRPEDYIKSDGYTPVTNSDLLRMRAYDPAFTNSNKVFQTIENAIGMEEVDKMIRERFQKLGTSEESRSGFMSNGAQGDTIAGANILRHLAQEDAVQVNSDASLEGLYKAKVITKTQRALAEAALKYIYQTLPKNAQILLGIRAGKPNLVAGAVEIIGNLIMGTENTSYSYDVDYVGGFDKVTGKGSGKKGDGSDEVELNTVSKWLAGFGDSETLLINLGGSNSFVVEASTMPLVKMNGDFLGANSTLQDAAQGQFSPILDLRNASMGMSIIDPSAFSQVVLSDGKITSIDFPCIERDGTIVPDLSMETRRKKDAAEAIIRSRGIDLKNPKSVRQNYSIINLIYEEQGLPAAYNADGSVNNQTWRRFGVINAATDGRVLGKGVNKSLVAEITDDYKADNIISIIQQNVKDYESTRKDWFGADALYQGTVWIPVRVNYHAAMAKDPMKVGEALRLGEYQQAYDTRNRLTLGRQP